MLGPAGAGIPSLSAAEDVDSPAVPSEDDLLELGVFSAPHGVHGELRLTLITDFPEQRLGSPCQLWVRPRTGWTRERGRGAPQPVRVGIPSY